MGQGSRPGISHVLMEGKCLLATHATGYLVAQPLGAGHNQTLGAGYRTVIGLIVGLRAVRNTGK